MLRMVTSGTGKKLSLELGGKNPIIVYETADLDSTVESVVDAIWFNQGQVCSAGSKLLIQESIFEKFIEKLKKRLQSFRIGNSLDKTVRFSFSQNNIFIIYNLVCRHIRLIWDQLLTKLKEL